MAGTRRSRKAGHSKKSGTTPMFSRSQLVSALETNVKAANFINKHTPKILRAALGTTDYSRLLQKARASHAKGTRVNRSSNKRK